jgi:hypothetical protein
MSHDLAPRAQIFRRDQAKVTDLDSFKEIMRYNNYKVLEGAGRREEEGGRRKGRKQYG